MQIHYDRKQKEREIVSTMFPLTSSSLFYAAGPVINVNPLGKKHRI